MWAGAATGTQRWWTTKTKTFTLRMVQAVVASCTRHRHHVDVRQCRAHTDADVTSYLCLRLGDVIGTAFNAATQTADALRITGVAILGDVIRIFSAVPDADAEGQTVLEQYQAQVAAAIRPAFTDDASPSVTAAACGVVGVWLTSGVTNDTVSLQRVCKLIGTLLTDSERLQARYADHNEAATTMVRAAVLDAWAAVYVATHGAQPTLRPFLAPHVTQLVTLWPHLLDDHARLQVSGAGGRVCPLFLSVCWGAC